MIENNQSNSREMEHALKALEQAKARVANERKKLNEKRRKEENHHKYLMGGTIVKYFPECYQFDEAELNKILRVALATNECQQIIKNIKGQNGENANQNTVEQGRQGRSKCVNRAGFFHPTLWGAHRYTTRGGMCALRGLLQRALSVLRQPTGKPTLSLRCKERTYPFVYFAFR